MVTRVSLSDWLAFQARIRGFKNPRLLRDRPTNGAALAAKIMRGCWVLCAGYGDVVVVLRRRFWKAKGYDMFMVGHAGQSFRLACLSGKNPGG